MSTLKISATTVKNDTRTQLLEAGIAVMIQKGYNNAGIAEILLLVGTPKGSFYHHFSSKEDFALAIIAHTGRRHEDRMKQIFSNTAMSPIARLRQYFAESRAYMVNRECRQGCLIGNLSQEMADQSETLRAALTDVLERGRRILADCITEAQTRNEIENKRHADELSEYMQSAWTGAMLLSKTQKSAKPLDTCINLIFEDLLMYRKLQ